MGLITQSIKISPRGRLIKYYRDKGYDFKCGDEVEINISDLSPTSRSIVECTCDYCGDLVYMEYQYYTKFVNTPTNKVCCLNCRSKKRNESNMIIYGVPNLMMLPEKQEKSRNTLYSHFGVSNPAYSNIILEKIRNTCYEKYNASTPLLNKGIIERIKKTVNEKYGCDNVFQNKEIIEKIRQSRYCNQNVPSSIQQIYICQLYNGELNKVISSYNCDIFLETEKIEIEYDGGGHRLSVKLGELTQEEFNQKEIVRDQQIKRAGYRIIRIISRKDYLPSDTVLLQMLQYARDFFSQNPQRSWLSFDIDNSCIYNTYHKEPDTSLQYDYGKLRKIKKTDLQDTSISQSPQSQQSSQTPLQFSAQ